MKRSKLTRREIIASGIAAAGGLILPATDSWGSLEASAESHTDLLIVGAGPFGLAIAAYAQQYGIRHQLVGTAMGFWRDNMPEGMLLRSTCDWSLDPLDDYSIDAYLNSLGKQCREVAPLSRNFYLDYARWFQQGRALQSDEIKVVSLIAEGDRFIALTDSGGRIYGKNVVVAVGFEAFAHSPPELVSLFPEGRCQHTCSLVDFGQLAGRRVLIIGGRQSAFEWAALIREAGADRIDVAYRHATPLFEPSDWTWVNPIVDNLAADPGWYRRLSEDEKQQLNRRFWEEGRLKLEPWLAPRIDHPNVGLHPHSNVIGAEAGDQGIEVAFDSGETFAVDEIVFATGYRVNLERLPFLAPELRSALGIQEGYAPLDVNFQTRVPGLYLTSLAATRDFGSFLAFTVSVRAQANVIGQSIRRSLQAHAQS